MECKACGVLIIHGFTATLDSVNALVRPLEALGVDVRVPVLKGHGEASPEKLRGVTWRDWMKDAESAFLELSAKAGKVFVVGHSMGGLIALNLAAKYQDRNLAAMVVAAPAFHLVSMLGPGRPLHFLVPLLQAFVRNWDLQVAYSDTDEMSRSVHYSWAPTDAIMSFFDLISFTQSRLHDIRCPTLILHGRKEQTVAPKSAGYVFDGIATPAEQKKLLWLDRSGHQMFCGSESEDAVQAVVDYVGAMIRGCRVS